MKLINKFKSLSSTAQGMIIIGIILLIGIIIRWNYIINEICKGFNYFSRD